MRSLPDLRNSFVLLGLCALAGCSSAPPSGHRTARAQIDRRYGVAPSPRVVADGEEVPRGGGYYMVGKPYQIAGTTYYPSEKAYSAVGLASWYGSDFHGRKTANGERFDKGGLTAAHKTLPLPCKVRVTNLRNGRRVVLRVNDRGPFIGDRTLDVTTGVAKDLGFHKAGLCPVRIEVLSVGDGRYRIRK